jgi:hypothetical protein
MSAIHISASGLSHRRRKHWPYVMSKRTKGGRHAFRSHLPRERARVGELELEHGQASAAQGAPAPPDPPPARHEHVARIG